MAKKYKVGLGLIAGPFLFLLLYFGATLVGLLFSHQKDFEGEKVFPVYMATGGIHADFILPIKTELYDWSSFINIKEYKEFNGIPRYIQLGWGDRGFYLDMRTLSNLTPDVALNAVLLPSPSLMHVTIFKDLPTKIFKIKKVQISKAQYLELVKYIKSGFQLKNGQVQLVNEKAYYHYPNMVDRFYEGEGKYHLFSTCNMWTAKGMYEAGIKTSIFTPFKYGVSRFIED